MAEASQQHENLLPGEETKDEYVTRDSDSESGSKSESGSEENEESDDSEEPASEEGESEMEEENEGGVADQGDASYFSFCPKGASNLMAIWDSDGAYNACIRVLNEDGQELGQKLVLKAVAGKVIQETVFRNSTPGSVMMQVEWVVQDIVPDELNSDELMALQAKYAEVIIELLVRAAYSTREQVLLEDAPIMLYALHWSGENEDQHQKLENFVLRACRNSPQNAMMVLRQCRLSKHCTKNLRLDHKIAKLLFTEQNMNALPAVVELYQSLPPFKYDGDVDIVFHNPVTKAIMKKYADVRNACSAISCPYKLVAQETASPIEHAAPISEDTMRGKRVGAVCVAKRMFVFKDGQVCSTSVAHGTTGSVAMQPPVGNVVDVVPNGKHVVLLGANQCCLYTPKTAKYTAVQVLPPGCVISENMTGCMLGNRVCFVVDRCGGAVRCLASYVFDSPKDSFELHEDIRFEGTKVHLLGGLGQHCYALHNGGVMRIDLSGEGVVSARCVVLSDERNGKPDLIEALAEAVVVAKRKDFIYMADKDGVWWEVVVSRNTDTEGKLTAFARTMSRWARVRNSSTSHTLAFVDGTQLFYVGADRCWYAVNLFASPVNNALQVLPQFQFPSEAAAAPAAPAAAAAAEPPAAAAAASTSANSTRKRWWIF